MVGPILRFSGRANVTMVILNYGSYIYGSL